MDSFLYYSYIQTVLNQNSQYSLPVLMSMGHEDKVIIGISTWSKLFEAKDRSLDENYKT